MILTPDQRLLQDLIQRAQSNRELRELFNHQAFIDIIKWAVERWSEFEEIINTSDKTSDRLRASDKKQVLYELLNILETKMEEDND